MQKEETYQNRLTRILQAVALEKPDRIPVVLEYAGFAAHVTQTPMAEFLGNPEKNLQAMIEAYRMVGGGDAINYGSFWPYSLCYDFMSKVSVPGVDLPENEMWQVVETELMTRDDYDRIVDLGWPAYFKEFMAQKILNDVPADYLPPRRKSPDVQSAWRKEDIPVLCGGDVTTPFELLCGSRSFMQFAIDLIEIPEKVIAAMDAIVPHLASDGIRRAKNRGYPLVWVGGWRTAPFMLSPDMWQRFAWPYFQRVVCEVVDAGLIALLHLDSDWTRELERFRELPKGKCIMALDGETDIFKARAVLDGHMCIMGDVPATMLFMDSPDAVYKYCTRLIRELGPQGFILQSGCDIPTNARLENVQAMVEAAGG
ncbi:MAG: uroporphyrinogen decarboxylase [Deltaproteobacteria bacterium]|nr:uroporphyrinogen decarboxylase [Deltaproteobacteria bacterium]MBW2677556.1 uroporphyrinogen decarboxylase [Deltaproteobacteria bacterium]